MKKQLKEMTLDELWAIFPIELVPHSAEWEKQAVEEIALLQKLLALYNPVISHIGSTAIPGIMAKPIVDILVEIDPEADFGAIKELMERDGYICMAASGSRMSFNKGYTPEGYASKVFHIHFHYLGDNKEITFRDYLRANPDATREYERLKIVLAAKFRNNRDAYTDGKTDFISSITAEVTDKL